LGSGKLGGKEGEREEVRGGEGTMYEVLRTKYWNWKWVEVKETYPCHIDQWEISFEVRSGKLEVRSGKVKEK
jgi:hypothetical protein